MRLKKRSEFAKVSRAGKRLVGRFLCVDYLASGTLRVGISASGRYGSAPERNRFKRLVREVVRKEALPNADLHVVPRQGAKGAGYSDIRDDFYRLLQS